MEYQTVIILGSLIGSIATIGGIIWKFSSYLAKSFNDVKDLIRTEIKSVLNKLEYHEQHDDKRFSDINNSMWELRIQNALLSKGVFLDKEIIREPRTTGPTQDLG